MKKFSCLALSVLLVFCLGSAAFAADVTRIEEYKSKFTDGIGPETNGVSIDYVSYSPEGEGKFPLVIWLHGRGEGAAPRAQIDKNNFALWASEELQERFTNGGAFLLAARAPEESAGTWQNKFIEPLKAAIDDFIEKNSDRIDLSRIYIGGFSMGGKMTLKMAASYPEMFAAAFPICPYYELNDAEAEAIADLPIWLTVSKFDILAGYYTFSQKNWEMICGNTNIPESCRLSLLGTVRYPDGKKTSSNHHAWFAVANDMFTYDGGDYYSMSTTDALGKEIKLDYPDGMISWLCSYTSDYRGQELSSTGFSDNNNSGELQPSSVIRMITALYYIIRDFINSPLSVF